MSVCLMWEQVFAHVLLQLAVGANRQGTEDVKVNGKVRIERVWLSMDYPGLSRCSTHSPALQAANMV